MAAWMTCSSALSLPTVPTSPACPWAQSPLPHCSAAGRTFSFRLDTPGPAVQGLYTRDVQSKLTSLFSHLPLMGHHSAWCPNQRVELHHEPAVPHSPCLAPGGLCYLSPGQLPARTTGLPGLGPNIPPPFLHKPAKVFFPTHTPATSPSCNKLSVPPSYHNNDLQLLCLFCGLVPAPLQPPPSHTTFPS